MGNTQTVVPYSGEAVTWSQFVDIVNPQFTPPAPPSRPPFNPRRLINGTIFYDT
jgi:hypothetical protein